MSLWPRYKGYSGGCLLYRSCSNFIYDRKESLRGVDKGGRKADVRRESSSYRILCDQTTTLTTTMSSNGLICRFVKQDKNLGMSCFGNNDSLLRFLRSSDQGQKESVPLHRYTELSTRERNTQPSSKR